MFAKHFDPALAPSRAILAGAVAKSNLFFTCGASVIEVDSEDMMAPTADSLSKSGAQAPIFRRTKMKRLPWVILSLLFGLTIATTAQNSNMNANKNTNKAAARNSNTNRGPVFRASADQIKQAQTMLKQRSFYSGEKTGKLDTATRAGLKQYQQAEGLKVTGTLNKATLEKMGIALTDKQRSM